MTAKSALLVLPLFLAAFQTATADSSTHLKQQLMKGYDKFDEPRVYSPLLPIIMTIKNGFIDEELSTLTINVIMQMRWMDMRLTWNESQYKVKRLILDPNEVTLPQIVLSDNGAPSTDLNRGDSQLVVYPRGSLLWVLPSARLSVFCSADLRKWPFDTKICTMSFRLLHDVFAGASRYHRAVHLRPNGRSGDSVAVVQGWRVEWREINQYHGIVLNTGIDNSLRFLLRRDSGILGFAYLIPVLVVMTTCLAGFWVAPTRSVSVFVNCFNVCFLCVFIIYFGNRFPFVNPKGTPVLMVVYCCYLYLLLSAVLFNIAVLNFAQTPPKYGLPWLIKAILTGRLKNILFTANYAIKVSATRLNRAHIPGTTTESSRNEEQEASTSTSKATESSQASEAVESEVIDLTENPPSRPRSELAICETCINSKLIEAEWILLAVTLQRIAFVTYGLVFFTLFIIYGVSYNE